MVEDKVHQALLLLEEAGRMDLIRAEARPRCRAGEGPCTTGRDRNPGGQFAALRRWAEEKVAPVRVAGWRHRRCRCQRPQSKTLFGEGGMIGEVRLLAPPFLESSFLARQHLVRPGRQYLQSSLKLVSSW
ncbi:hypothetical protein NDU88_002564 [Pleurodeles waltl]|uniref:Cyclic nucleotide-binding domain-containing protein n=1 Tax=Pleurodeles waltl TaxID=8319 RepID=A0AAV7UVZ6_PLEWA|nr:hypothetical protein NDU88_002564 [Pleurodeles waltl]